MTHSIKKFIPVLFLILCSLKLSAQYPVQIIPQLIGPYSLTLSDYYSGTAPKLSLIITNRDLQSPALSVILKINISSSVVQIKSVDNALYVPIILDAGIPYRVSQNEMETYFNPNNLIFQGIDRSQYIVNKKLPEGLYNFCFEVLDANTKQAISPSQCAMAWISLSDPPFLNTPFNNSDIIAKDPTNIVFNWTPRHLSSPNSAFNTQYEFQLVEIWDNNINVNAAFISSKILYTTTTSASTLLYGMAQPLLIPGKKYAWRVKVLPLIFSEDNDQFRNNGYSDIFSFNYNELCKSPTNVRAVKQDNDNFTIFWNAENANANYEVAFKEDDSTIINWTKAKTNNSDYTIRVNKQNRKYIFTVSTICSDGTKASSSEVLFNHSVIDTSNASTQFSIFDKAELKGKLYWAYYNADIKDETAKPLVVDDCDAYAAGNFRKNLTTENKAPLANADLFLYKTEGNNKTLISLTRSNEAGEYLFKFDSSFIKPEITLSIEAKHTSKMMTDEVMVIRKNAASNVSDLSINNDAVLYLKSIGFIPNITCTTIDSSSFKRITMDIMVRKSDWDKTYGLISHELKIDDSKTAMYNNALYVIVATIKDGKTYTKLLKNIHENKYVARISYNNEKIKFIDFSKTVNEFTNIKQCFNYNLSYTFSGIISNMDIPKHGTRVRLILNRSDLKYNLGQRDDLNRVQIRALDLKNVFWETRSSATGYYQFENLYYIIKPGAAITIEVLDNTVSIEPFYETIQIGDAYEYSKNVKMGKRVYSILGRLIEEDGGNGKPIANAKVTLEGHTAYTFTNEDGYYMLNGSFRIPASGESIQDFKINFAADGYETDLYTYVRKNAALKLDEITLKKRSEKWASYIRNAHCFDNTKYDSKRKSIDADVIGCGNDILEDLYPLFYNPNIEILDGVCDIAAVKLVNKNTKYFTIRIEPKLNGNRVNANFDIYKITDGERIFIANKSITDRDFYFEFNGVIGNYECTVTSKSETQNFVPFKGTFRIKLPVYQDGNMVGQTYTILLSSGIKFSGVISSKNDGRKLDSTSLEIEGLPLSATTDEQGNYSMTVDKNKYYRLTIYRPGYLSIDTSLQIASATIANFILTKGEGIKVKIKTLLNFEVVLDEQLPNGSDKNYLISGKLKIASNDVFNTVEGDSIIKFRNVPVVIKDNSGNAIPLLDVVFEQSTLNAQAFGYVPVEIRKLKLSKIPNPSGGEEIGVIGGTEIRARLSTVGLNSLVPLQLKDAIIQELDSGRNTKFSYAFISPKKKINGMTKEKEYKLKFLTAAVADTGANAGYLDVSIMPKVSLFINKQTAILSSDRIKMNGYFPIPKEISKKGNTTNNITISTFAILKNLSSYDVSFEIGVDSPVFLPIQKIMAKLTRIDLIGLGSANCGIGFGGEIWLKKKDRLSKDKDGVLTINKMEIVNKESGVTLAASMTLPDSGFSIKKLIFKTPGTSIDMAYDFGDHSFSFEAAGRLEFASIDTTGFFKDVFPIEIQSFKMRSKDWGVFLLAKPDIKINYKVVTINIEKLLINIGYDMSMDKMSELMTTPNKPQTFVSGGPDEEVSEDKTSWAIGIAGGVAFPIKDLKVDVRASLILANQNNAIQARLNKIAIVVDRSPVFLLKAGVMLSLSGKKKGFEADAALTVLSNGLEAYFKYYKIEADNNGTKAGMELGAAIKLKSSTGITTGPINWLSIGGGFDLNTSTNVYSAFLTGDITTPGTTRDMTYVAIDTLKILFSTNDCGPKPVVDGTGRLFIKNQAWGEIKAKADFCKNLMLVTVNASIPLIAGLPNISASGILFGMASSSSGSGAFFLSVNSTITSQIANGNVFAALGVNYNNNHIYAPQEIKTLWPSITEKIKDNYNTLHGIYFRAGVNIPYTSGGFDAGFVGLNYSYYLDGQADFGVKFGGTNDLFVNASLRFQLWAEAYLLFIKGYGNVDVNVSLNGGRLNQLWYLRGNGDATVDIGVGDWPGQYNSWVCHLDTWWVGCRWVKGFNVNKGLNASFDFTQGQSTKYNIRFK